MFTSAGCRQTLYLFCISSLNIRILSNSVVSILAKDIKRLSSKQVRFLYCLYPTHILSQLYDYSSIVRQMYHCYRPVDKISMNILLSTPLLNGFLDVSDLLSIINFSIPSFNSKNHSFFYVPSLVDITILYIRCSVI